MAAASIKVAASILSGMTVWLAPPRLLTPSILMVSVPAPFILAPILLRKLARSTISGSSAAFSIYVVPSASTAAVIIFSVAPTLGKSRYMVSPTRPCPPATASTYPSSSQTVMIAPRASKPLRCRSIGLLPMAQPPGRCTFARPFLASSGPITKIEARIWFTSSKSASVESISFVSMERTSSPDSVISDPRETSNSFIRLTSRR